ncbi:hypothetical protein F4803DRAFT_38239 [Xylaria telfairii]|nr:hypothetical protein F4803DRAFT_38239 [Xylaria telfairii]
MTVLVARQPCLHTKRALVTCLVTGGLAGCPGSENDHRLLCSCSVRTSIHSKIMADARRQCSMTLLSRQFQHNTWDGLETYESRSITA